MNPGEGLLILPISLGEWPRLPFTASKKGTWPLPTLSYQFSNFSLRRAACSISHCARPTRAFSGRALREHRRPTGCPLALLPNSVTYSPQGGLVDPQMRASNEHLPSVRVPRAGGRPGYPVSLLFEQPLHPCLNLFQSLAQVGFKHIGFGLHDLALGLELIFERLQLDE